MGRAGVTKRAGELWQGGEDKSCDKKVRIERKAVIRRRGGELYQGREL